MLSEGHPNPFDYPIGMVFDEIELCSARESNRIGMEGLVLQSAVGTAVAAFSKDGGKSAGKSFTKMINKLMNVGKKQPPPFRPKT